MKCSGFQYSTHAVKRMIDKNISTNEIEQSIMMGEVIRDYPDDKPYPSKLFLNFINGRPIHVVAAQIPETLACIIVTCYQPDIEIWMEDFKTKRDL